MTRNLNTKEIIETELNVNIVSLPSNSIHHQKKEDSEEEIEHIEVETYQDDEPKTKLTKLPIGRIRYIIKTDPDINLVNQEAVFLITKATEFFIDSFVKEAYKYTFQSKKKTVQKHDVQSAIDNTDTFLFLDGIN